MTDEIRVTVLNPGSPEAVQYGCTCPVLENNMGQVAPLPDDHWYVDVNCALHGNGLAVDTIPPLNIDG